MLSEDAHTAAPYAKRMKRSRENIIHPEFKAFHQRKPDHCNHAIPKRSFIAFRKNAVRNCVVGATCAFCLKIFSHINASKMRIHLTGEEEEANTRVTSCPKVPKDCRIQIFYSNLRDSDASSATAYMNVKHLFGSNERSE
jgi:hypothetical protein